ncbi:hypothetical protein BDY21DRAFT_366959 [Lineolata rhizophorae]|uniref:ERCC4 domain-containing protein n=1 Tax=Lineolata rhizophorae TaxID=578093 RepID=A0A6A6NNQ5_9PEZI|nr:hypothetical protein BDY21DRAFT_366959 [Lineolata rhizophorae]
MTGEDKAPVKLSLPLEFQQDAFRELRSEDQLVIIARGLGLVRLATNLLHAYDAAGSNLALVVGADDRENKWLGEGLAEHAARSGAPACRGLTLVNTDLVSVAARERMYARGGVFSITSRILIIDFLSGLLDPATVSGVVVLHAERVVATSLEAFILRIYRQKNKAGFLKAFSDSPEPFTTGFAPLQTMLRNLFLRKTALYPRFHIPVQKSLEGKRRAEVIELVIDMTDNMRAIQNAILECIEVSIQELKKSNSGIEMEDWNTDSALHKNFDVIVRRQLDPVWHRTSFRTRQIVRDLTLLRTILQYDLTVLTYDAVSFQKYLDTVLAASAPPPGTTRSTQSPWLFLDAAHTLFDTAKRRVYTGKLPSAKQAASTSGTDQALQPVLEELPKWAQLADVLEEIERDIYFNPPVTDDSNGTVLIMCGDQRTCSQLREYLQTMWVQPNEGDVNEDDKDVSGGAQQASTPSASFMMRRKLRNYLAWKRDFSRVSANLFAENQKSINGQYGDARGGQSARGRAPPNKRRRVRGGASAAAAGGPARTASGSVTTAGDKDAHVASLLAELAPTEAEAAQKGEIGADPLEDMDDYYKLYEMKDLVIVHPYDGDMDEHVLEEVRPRYVVMYEPEPAFIKRLEVYRSSHTGCSVKVYLMYYGASVEEQRLLSAIRREKDAFTKLIRERGAMALTLNSTAPPDPQEQFLRTVNTRIAGGGRVAAATAQPPRVVVDVREFRSSLPSLLHAAATVVVPCMLTVGDYVLTPDVCVERKSVRDLIASLANGRLFNQAETMLLHYRTPALLIEFDVGKSFTLEPFSDVGGSAASGPTGSAGAQLGAPDLQAKIAMLALAFPRLRIVWSSSPYQTAEIFAEIKKNAEEPDPVRAVQAGLEDGGAPAAAGAGVGAAPGFAQTPLDMLREVPGVTDRVAARLALEVGSLAELANLDEDEIAGLVGREAARQVWRFFNRDVYED